MPRKLSVAIGERFGKLIVSAISERVESNGGRRAVCQCDCGSMKEIAVKSLRKGGTKSCGCVRDEIARQLGRKSKTHEKSDTRTYVIWAGIKQRSTNPKNPSYQDYGGRGICLCAGWHSFERFLEDMGEAPDGAMIDRIDVNGDYTKGNCRWVSKELSSENKRVSRLVLVDGRVLSIEKASREVGIPASTLRHRFKNQKPLGGGLEYAK